MLLVRYCRYPLQDLCSLWIYKSVSDYISRTLNSILTNIHTSQGSVAERGGTFLLVHFSPQRSAHLQSFVPLYCRITIKSRPWQRNSSRSSIKVGSLRTWWLLNGASTRAHNPFDSGIIESSNLVADFYVVSIIRLREFIHLKMVSSKSTLRITV